MGEQKRRRLSQQQMLVSEPRCVYCESRGPLTVEHMPPRAMFKARRRPKGMEFAACVTCNDGTRASDAVAAMISRIALDEEPWKRVEFEKLYNTVGQQAPDVLAEINSSKITSTFGPYTDGLHRPYFQVDIKGGRISRHIGAFASKLGMAAYRNYMGEALPLDGVVWSHWVFNGGMTPEKLNSMISIMPMGATLTQGKVEVSDQFYYRYNTDGRSTVALTTGFHSSLWIMTLASSEPMIVGALRKEQRLLPFAVASPGGLLDILNDGGTRGKVGERPT